MFRLGSGSGRLSVVSISQLPDSRDQTSPEAHPSMRRTHEGHSSARGLAISGGAHDMSNPPPAESGFRPVHNGYHANRNTWMSLLSLLAFDTRDGRLNDNYGLELIDLENLGHQTMNSPNPEGQGHLLPDSYLPESPANIVSAQINQRTPFQTRWASRRIPPCYILIVSGILTIAGSLAPALWRSTNRSDVSGGFSLAQYMLGVGVFVIGSVTVIHSKTCTCWQ